ncbi:transmembrane protein, putative (macronuclear) [Tetrahymena thermophila SB210]|uniref:Transmembrane protein, putative n=1 Tax=Tetrahymena thermophila (strain SB210) TaxID=312017 RepID=I7MFJ1_TETTS|nr:transmembrane protein, putative [Tetrahymena thermophila SB210]EAR84001.2 transmembrane protein, putative [Tetrahymena thermophila SB210]|eukprot:XP_001031664.2 transmembrane protein, putative [Tetrahymena thermophila SB210]
MIPKFQIYSIIIFMKAILLYCETIQMLVNNADFNMQNVNTLGFLQKNALNNCDFTSVNGQSIYGGLNCFVAQTSISYYGPYDQSGQFYQLQPHYQVILNMNIYFFFPLGDTQKIGQVQIKLEQNQITQSSQSSNCASYQDANNSNYPFMICSFSFNYFHQFDTLSIQLVGINTASSFSWGISQLKIQTTECTASCLICNASQCLQNKPSNLLNTQMLYYYEKELYEQIVQSTQILNKYCLINQFVFLNQAYYPFIGLPSNLDPSLLSPQTILIELQNLPAHYSIYIQFKLIQASCGQSIKIYNDDTLITFNQQQTACLSPPTISYVWLQVSPHRLPQTTFSIQQQGSPFGIRELKVFFDLCQSTCSLCSNDSSCDTDNGKLLIASFAYQVNSANLIREDWIVIGSPSTNFVSTCNNINYFGGINIFDWKTKVLNNFHITNPHYSAILEIKFIKMGQWGTNKIVIIIDGRVFKRVSFCDSNIQICSSAGSAGGDQIKQIYFEFSHFSYDMSISIQPDIQSAPSTSLYWGFINFSLTVRQCHSSCVSNYCTGPLPTDCGLPQINLFQIRSFFSYDPPSAADPSWSISNQQSTCGSSISQSCTLNNLQFYGGQTCFNQNTQLSKSFAINDSFVFMVIQFNFIKFSDWVVQGSLIVMINQVQIYQEYFSSLQANFNCYSSTSQDIVIYPVKILMLVNSVTQQNFQLQIYTQSHQGHWGIQSFQLDIYGCSLGNFLQNNSCQSCNSQTCLACTNTNLCFSKCHYSCASCYGEGNYQCLSCDSSLKRTLDGSVCKCIDGFFEIGQPVCQKCHQTCLQCTDIFINSCSFCDKNLYRQLDQASKKCVCIDRYYEVLNQFQCQPCHYSCQSCNGNLDTNCLTCSLSSDYRVYDPISGKCLCQIGYFEDPNLKKCLPCQLKCHTCVDTPTNCTQCSKNRINIPSCLCPIANKVWLDGELCNLCDSTCQTCFGDSFNECSTCVGNLYLYDFQCVQLCPYFIYFGHNQNNINTCLDRCPEQSYQIKKRLCCQNNSEPCIEEVTSQVVNYGEQDNKQNTVKLQFSRPVRVEYMQGYSRVILLSMENISSFQSKITPLDEQNGYVSQIDIYAIPQQSVLYSILQINLLADFIRDKDGIPHSQSQSQLTAKFGKTEFIPQDQVDTIQSASQKAKQTSQVISIMGTIFYFLNVCQLLDIVVDVMQWSYYYTFINVEYPINSDLFFSTFNSININIKLFGIDIQSGGKKKVLGNELVNQDSPQKFMDQNITSSFMINGANLLVTLTGFVVGRYLLVSIHDCYNQTEDDHKHSIVCQALKFVKNFLTFSPIIKYIQNSFFALVFSVCLQLRNMDSSNSFNNASIAICFMTIFAFLASIIYFMYKVNNAEKEFNYIQKYGSLFEFYIRSKFITRNFAFWIFIKKLLMMSSLVLFYDYFYTNLIIMGSVCFLFAIMIYFFKPYTIVRMNDFHIFSEFLLIICFVLIYQIQDCNNQIAQQSDQGIDQNIVNKKLFLGWWLIIITISHIAIMVCAISSLLWGSIKQHFHNYKIQIINILALCYTKYINKIQFLYRSIIFYCFDKSTINKIWLPNILKKMKSLHEHYMDCSNKGRWKSNCQILLTEELAIKKFQNAQLKYSFGDFVFFIEQSANQNQFRAWVWSESYQYKLHEQAGNYFQDKIQISRTYQKRYENNPLYIQIFKKMFQYSHQLNKKVQVDNLLDNYSEIHFSELYNLITFRNYWNFINSEVTLKHFLKQHDISEIYFSSNNNNNNNNNIESNQKIFENQNLKNLNISFEQTYVDKIKINRCDCKYCQSLFYAKEYLDKIDWKLFDHLKESYIQPEELLIMFNKFDEKTILLFKDILNERVNIMETGQVISYEEIENSYNELIDDPFYTQQSSSQNQNHTYFDLLDTSEVQTKKQLKKKLINSELEMTNVQKKKQNKPDSKEKNDKVQKNNNKNDKKKNKKKQNNGNNNQFSNFFKNESSESEEEQEEIEEIINITQYVRFKIFKWTEC